LGGRNDHLGQAAEAGGHPIDLTFALQEGLNESPGPLHGLPGLRGEGDLNTRDYCKMLQILQREVGSRQLNGMGALRGVGIVHFTFHLASVSLPLLR
jgi:hypothetical protein